jgi:ribosomal-protein-alanine N-acetyltransferase
MRRDDCSMVAAIDRSCFPEAWSEASFHDAMRQPQYSFLVLETDEQIIGYISMLHTAQEGEITRVALIPEQRRQGHGSCLVESMLQWAEQLGLHSIFLEVRRSNDGAKALYEKYHFQVIGERKNYYKQPTEDALIMQLQIR